HQILSRTILRRSPKAVLAATAFSRRNSCRPNALPSMPRNNPARPRWELPRQSRERASRKFNRALRHSPPTDLLTLQELLRKSGRDFVEIVERIFQSYPPHAAKAGLCAHFVGVALMKSQCTQPQTTPRQRGSHARQDAETV